MRHRGLGRGLLGGSPSLVPGNHVHRPAHRIATAIEYRVAAELESETYVTTHLEANEDHHRVHSGRECIREEENEDRLLEIWNEYFDIRE